jgi:hypothetical protein
MGPGVRRGDEALFPAHKSNFLNGFNNSAPTSKSPPKTCQASLVHNILIFRNDKSVYIHSVPSHSEGRLAIVTDAGRDAVAAAARETGVLKRTAKSCGSDASGLAFKFLGSKLLRGDGDKKDRIAGESAYKP